MEVRLARLEDAEAIRAIYNAEVLGSTATFDLQPRSAEAQRAWVAHHQGAHPALVAVEGRRWSASGPCRRFATALRIHHGRGLPLRRGPGATTVSGDCCSTSSWRWPRPRVPHRDRPDLRSTTSRPSRCTGHVASCRSASSARWAGNSGAGSTWPSCSGCSERAARPGLLPVRRRRSRPRRRAPRGGARTPVAAPAPSATGGARGRRATAARSGWRGRRAGPRPG